MDWIFSVRPVSQKPVAKFLYRLVSEMGSGGSDD
jgi:hypothetical protein